MNGKQKALFVIGVFIISPVLVYLFLRFFSVQHYQRLEKIGPRTVRTTDGSVRTIETVFDAFDDYQFYTQTGAPFSVDSLKGHVFVADVFFSRCTGICPKLSAGLSKLHSTYEEMAPDIRFLSITVDPENDSVPALAEYAERYGADPNRWYFITGKKKELYDVAHNGFMFKAMEGEGGELGFIHDEKIMLVDKDGIIRKGDHFYDGTNPSDIELIQDEIRVLMLEYLDHDAIE